MKSLHDSIAESFDILLENISFKKPQGIATGYKHFDNMLRGIHKGNLTVIAAPPSPGKTALALNIVNNLANRQMENGILFCSDLSNTELTCRLLAIASGVSCSYERDYQNDDVKRLTASASKLKDYPLYFAEHSGVNTALLSEIRTIHTRQHFELLIADNVRPEECRKLKELASELNIAVLALVSLYSKKDEILSRGIANTLVIMNRDRKVNCDPDLGTPVDLVISKNQHGLCGVSRMYFIPEIMLFKESCAGDQPFAAIPEIYETITPYTELKRYITPDKLPLLEHLRAEIPQNSEDIDLEKLLRLSARLEATGDHASALKVFLMGRKECSKLAENIECVYDLLYAAMYSWLYRKNDQLQSFMEKAAGLLDNQSRREYNELQRRIQTYPAAAWIKASELED
ncbi:MAG: hypothetical protein J6Q81_05605 [Lentisphaeria bacterium]|nr:hypothetical protein [Lentisphaeria bacterium]